MGEKFKWKNIYSKEIKDAPIPTSTPDSSEHCCY